jgi:cytochrome P450
MSGRSPFTIDSLPFLDVLSPEYREDPLKVIGALGEGWPMARRQRGLELLKYDLCWNLLTDKRFSIGFEELLSICRLTPDGTAYRYFLCSIAALEGESHRRQRDLLTPLLRPASIERARWAARHIATELLDDLPGNEFDFALAVAPKVVSAFLCHLIGAPMVDHALIAACSENLLKVFCANPAYRHEIEAAADMLIRYVREHIELKRNNLGKDAVSWLIQAEQRGETTIDEIVEILFTLIAVSTDNTSSSLSHTVAVLAENPDQWKFLRDNPSVVPHAIQECARVRPTVWSDPRIAREDQEFYGVSVPKGTRIFASIVASNHDPLVFDKPQEFRILRERSKPLLNFGAGRHACLGRAVALVELEETLRLLVERFSRIEVVGEVVRDGHPHGDFVRSLPVRMTKA